MDPALHPSPINEDDYDAHDLPPLPTGFQKPAPLKPIPVLGTVVDPPSLNDNRDTDLSSAMAALMQRAMAADSQGDEPVPVESNNDEGFSGLLQENLALMDPDNPLMKRVQDRLLAQLTSVDDRLTLEIREKEEALKRTKEEREQVGVELYSFQQQLAKQQTALEDSHAAYSVIQSHRKKAERGAADARTATEKQRADLAGSHKALEARKQELEGLARTLGQMQLYHDEMKSRLATTRRVTLKSEEDLLKQEQEKRKQDFYIHQLSQRLERLKDQRATIEQQTGVQQAEIRVLHSAIQEANAEMEAIVFEKRQLFHQWKSGLIGMQRRQDVLAAMDVAVRKENERLLTMDTELAGYKTTLATMAVENETLSLLHDKLTTEAEYLQDQIKQIGEKRSGLRSQYSGLQRALEAAEADAKRVSHTRQTLVNEINVLKKQVLGFQQKVTKVEREIAEQMQHQMGIDKGVMGSIKDARKLTQSIHDKEGDVAAAENQVAAIKLEGSNVAESIRGLRAELGNLDSLISGKNQTIEKYEVEIRRGNDEMVKKQSEIDLLNKKLSQFLGNSNDEALGPLEATIHNLSKSISSKDKECWELQQFWLRTQNELVTSTKKASELAEQISTLKMRHTILTRKRAMINQEFDNEEQEIKRHSRQIKALQNEMIKMNTLISKQSNFQAVLGESTLGLEHEFRYRLKEAELEAVRLEQQVRNLKSEKDRALSGLLDIEQQIMLWEKKIQLAKETREALDPNIGAQEIQEMTAEIHRMELRLANLQSVQEKLITEMEKAVTRRETIAVRAKLRGKGYTQATINKAISDLNRQLKATLGDLRDVDRDIATLNEALGRAHSQVDEAAAVLDAMRRDQATIVGDIQLHLDTKAALFSEVSLWQKKTKRYQSIKESKYVFLKPTPEERVADMEKAVERLCKVEKAVHLLITDCAAQLGPTTRSLESFVCSARSLVPDA